MLNAKTSTMKRFLILLTFSVLVVTSCKKDHSLRKKALEKMTFQGKYLGEGCWSVIQIIKPSINSTGLDQSGSDWYPLSSNHDTVYHDVVGAGLIPETYRNGDTFYFTVSKIDSNLIHVDNCDAPKYYFTIKTISFKDSNNNEK